MMWIFQDEIPEHKGVFIDDGRIKGPSSNYDKEVLEENPGIQYFIWEDAQTLEGCYSGLKKQDSPSQERSLRVGYWLWTL